jgi:hypothetical protein
MNIFEIILGIFSVLLVFLSYYISVRQTLQEKVGDAINEAEKTDLIGEEKMAYAVEQIYQLVPTMFKPILTKPVIEGIVQQLFDKMQDFAKKQKNDKKTKNED